MTHVIGIFREMSTRKAYLRTSKSTKSPARRKSGRKVQYAAIYVPQRNRFSLTNPAQSSKPESKNNDVQDQVGIVIPINAVFSILTLLNGIAQGNNATTRIGRKIMMKSVSCRYSVSFSGGEFNRVRVLLIYDRQTNLALPAITDILNTNTFNGHMNLTYADRFVVVADEYTEQSQLQGANFAAISGKIYRKLNLDVMYNGNTGVIANVSTGALYLIVAQDNYGAGLGQGLFIHDTRVRYTDV